MELPSLSTLIFLSGIAQVVLSLGSIAIPFILNWRSEMTKVNVLIRNIFYTYSVYILMTNIWFGTISICLPDVLVSPSPLSAAVTIFIALYWWGRVGVQFLFGQADGRPSGIIYSLGEVVLWLLFIVLSIVYTWAALHNFHIL